MIVVSKGGLGKTSLAEEMLKDVKWFRGHVTPLSFYRELSEHQGDELQIVLDDLDLFKSSVMIGLIKQATDTKSKQILSYNSTHQIAEMLNKTVIKKISTLILLNKANLSVNPDLQAIQDRGLCVEFKPSNEEIYNYAICKKLGNLEVNTFLSKYYRFALNFSLRSFVKSVYHFKMGDNWQPRVLKELRLEPRLAEVISLQDKFKTDKERVNNYSKSRRDYYRKKKIAKGEKCQSAKVSKKCEGDKDVL